MLQNEDDTVILTFRPTNTIRNCCHEKKPTRLLQHKNSDSGRSSYWAPSGLGAPVVDQSCSFWCWAYTDLHNPFWPRKLPQMGTADICKGVTERKVQRTAWAVCGQWPLLCWIFWFFSEFSVCRGERWRMRRVMLWGLMGPCRRRGGDWRTGVGVGKLMLMGRKSWCWSHQHLYLSSCVFKEIINTFKGNELICPIILPPCSVKFREYSWLCPDPPVHPTLQPSWVVLSHVHPLAKKGITVRGTGWQNPQIFVMQLTASTGTAGIYPGKGRSKPCSKHCSPANASSTSQAQPSPGMVPSPSRCPVYLGLEEFSALGGSESAFSTFSVHLLCIYCTFIAHLFSWGPVNWVSGNSVGILPPLWQRIGPGPVSAGQCKCPNVLKVFIKLLKSDTYFSPAH